MFDNLCTTGHEMNVKKFTVNYLLTIESLCKAEISHKDHHHQQHEHDMIILRECDGNIGSLSSSSEQWWVLRICIPNHTHVDVGLGNFMQMVQ